MSALSGRCNAEFMSFFSLFQTGYGIARPTQRKRVNSRVFQNIVRHVESANQVSDVHYRRKHCCSRTRRL